MSTDLKFSLVTTIVVLGLIVAGAFYRHPALSVRRERVSVLPLSYTSLALKRCPLAVSFLFLVIPLSFANNNFCVFFNTHAIIFCCFCHLSFLTETAILFCILL